VTGEEKKEKVFKMPAPFKLFHTVYHVLHGFKTGHQNKKIRGEIAKKFRFTTYHL
jgi:hypothetical protein